MGGKTKRKGRERTFKTKEQVQTAVYFYLLNYSRSKHAFPDISRKVERKLKIDGRTYNLDFKAIKEQVIRHRVIDDILRKRDATISEIQKEVGIGVYNYLDALGGYKTFSELFFAYRGKKPGRKFVTREKALNVFRNKVEKVVLDEQYKDQVDIQNKVGTQPATYDINWKKDVLDFVHEKLIREELEKNPRIKFKALQKDYPFALETVRRIGSFPKLKRKFGIIYKSHSNREELLENCVNVKRMLAEKTSYDSIQKEVGACLGYWNVTFEDIDTRVKFANSMSNSKPFEVKNKTLTTYANLILELVEPKDESITTEEKMWDHIKEKTGESPNSFDVTNVKNYLLYTKQIEGSTLNGGYWRME